MEEIIKTFGIDSRLIVIQIINFAILLAALWYFLYKPVLKMLNDREEKIKQGVADAESAAAAKAAAETEKQTILATAHSEAAEVNARAKTAADQKASEIVADAQEKSAAIVKDAERKGEDIKTQAEKESEAEIAKLAVLAAEKVLRQKTS